MDQGGSCAVNNSTRLSLDEIKSYLLKRAIIDRTPQMLVILQWMNTPGGKHIIHICTWPWRIVGACSFRASTVEQINQFLVNRACALRRFSGRGVATFYGRDLVNVTTLDAIRAGLQAVFSSFGDSSVQIVYTNYTQHPSQTPGTLTWPIRLPARGQARKRAQCFRHYRFQGSSTSPAGVAWVCVLYPRCVCLQKLYM